MFKYETQKTDQIVDNSDLYRHRASLFISKELGDSNEDNKSHLHYFNLTN